MSSLQSDGEYFLEVDVQYPENLLNLHNDLKFLPEKIKIQKFEKLVTNLYDKTKYVNHIKILKQTINHRLVLKKVNKVVTFNQEA